MTGHIESTEEVLAHAERLYAERTHPAELARRQREHQAALIALRNNYIDMCHTENQRYLLALMKVLHEHDVKDAGKDGIPACDSPQGGLVNPPG